MPISEGRIQETGDKSSASGLIASVPIKKRRFPLIPPSSPVSEEQPCSLTEETELPRKENSSTSQGSTLSNASIVAGAPIKKRRFPLVQTSSSSLLEEGSPPEPEESDAFQKEYSNTSQGSTISSSSSGLSDANGNPVFEERKASYDVTDANIVHSNSYYLRPKLEEPNLAATESCDLDIMDSNEKVTLDDGKGNPELLLAVKEGLALNRGADVSKLNVQQICKQEGPVVRENTNLSLGLQEHLFRAVSSLEVGESCLKMVKTEPVSLKLSLSKEECSTQSLISDTKTNSSTAHVHSNRANWDLNTTMDAWEEPATDSGSVKTSIDGPRIIGSALDEKHYICSTGLVPPTGTYSVKQTCEESQNKAFMISSGPHGQQYKCINPRDLCLTSGLQKYAEEPSRLSTKLNSGGAVSLASLVASVGDVNAASFRMVKLEPFDGSLKRDLKDAIACPVSSLDGVAVKQEIIAHPNFESCKSSNGSNLKLVDPRLIKPEPGHDGDQETPKTAESKTDELGLELPQVSDNCSSTMAMAVTLDTVPISAEPACPPVKPTCSVGLTTNENTVSQLENCTSTREAHVEKVSHGTCSSAEQVSLQTVGIAMVDNVTELSGPAMKDSSIRTKEENADDHEGCRLKLMNEPPPDPRDSGVSDEEKIPLSAEIMEDDSYDSDCESDDNDVTIDMDTEPYDPEDDDYEDGEVREPLEHRSTAEDIICEVREVENPDCSSCENKHIEKAVVSGDCITSSHVEGNDNKTVIHSEINSGEEGRENEMHERSGKVTDKNVCLQGSLDVEKSTIASDGKRQINVLQRKSLDLSERKNISKALETELSSDQTTDGSHAVDVVQCANEVIKTTDTVRKAVSELPKMEASANTDDASKDVSNGGNQGRIINLSRAANGSSPSKTRSISGRSLPSRVRRDLLSDALDGDKLHRGRDEVYIDGPRKFSRERHQDMSPRNSRINFGRGRGRIKNRLDTFRCGWESDHEFSDEFYNGPSKFLGTRPKYASAIGDTELEFNNVAPDGSYVGNGRVGRKPLNDGSYIASRRRSPGGRDAIQMGHRIPRTMSPSRCIGGDGSEVVGIRHSEKFMRGFPEDNLDSMYTRPQPFQGLDGRFTRGGRSFSSTQGRGGLSRIRSKSPIRSRSRTPGAWSSPRRRSPRRRSPDGFGGHPELNHRRSPLYRVDRTRSPDRPVFPRARVVRRRGSPSYMSRPSNDIRDIDSARDHGPRSVISSRSPSGRILIRNRRFDVVDPCDRADDDYFGGPVHSGRLLELSDEGNGEERRRFGERRGPVRSFRPPYNGNVGENFHLSAEEGPPRHYRFCSDDSDFHERGNLRERDFDRRIKGRPANVPPRRIRNIDEQEENYRHGGQVWSDDSFDDISRVKRKRF